MWRQSGQIIERFERKGFKLCALKLRLPTRELVAQHYKQLADRPYFPAMVEYMSSGPVVCMVRQSL